MLKVFGGLTTCRSPAVELGELGQRESSHSLACSLAPELESPGRKRRLPTAVQGSALAGAPRSWEGRGRLGRCSPSPCDVRSQNSAYCHLCEFCYFFVYIKLVHSSCARLSLLMTEVSFLPVPSSACTWDNCSGSIHQQSCIPWENHSNTSHAFGRQLLT